MNNVSSPRTDDVGIEQQIVNKGLTAPRITPADINANISGVYFFTASQGVSGREALNLLDGGKHVSSRIRANTNDPLNLLTFCVIQLANGFTVTGESACASPENFDAQIGQNIAYENAKQKIWPLMGYELRSHLAAKA